MNFRITPKRVLATGLVMSLIFVAFSTSYTAHGSERDQVTATTKQRSRLHPKRMFSGLKRGVSKLFGRSKYQKVEQAPVKTAPRSTVGQEINRKYAQQGVQPVRPTQRPIVTRQIKRTLPKRTLAQPSPQVVKAAPQQQPARPVKIVAKQRKTNPFLKGNPFAEQDSPVETQSRAKVNRFAKATAPVEKKTSAKINPFAAEEQQPETGVKQVSSKPEDAPEIKHMLGYCPVNLKQGKFRRGKQQYHHVYEGRTYKFDSLTALDEFRRNPASFAPVLQGMDVVDLTHTGHHVEGYLSFSCDFDGRFYLFRTVENQEAFLANPAAYSLPE